MQEENDRSNRLPVDEVREHLMIKVARMTYHMDSTQAEIGAETGLTRWQVSKLLQEAKELGIVRIEIVPVAERSPSLEAELKDRYGLLECVVVPVASDESQPAESVAKAAGQYLATLQPRPSIVGVSWGRTMAAVAHWLPQGWHSGVTVVQINGTMVRPLQSGRSNHVVETFARKGRGRAVPFPVPAILGEAVTREVLERDRIVGDVLEIARSADVVCLSIGALDDQSALVPSGNTEAADLEGLSARGAVGDILGRFITRDATIADPTIDARTTGLSLEDLRSAPSVICVVAGQSKLTVTQAVLRGKLVSTLILDDGLARALLETP